MSRSAADFNGGIVSGRPDMSEPEDSDRPAPTTRRAGPIGPNTEAEERQWQQEIAWSRAH